MSQKSLTSFFKRKDGGAVTGKEKEKPAVISSNVTEKNAKGSASPSSSSSSSTKRKSDDDKVDTGFRELLEESWREMLKKELEKTYFKNLEEFLGTEFNGSTPIYPPKNQIFTAFDLCPFKDVKVVILGQDPYHGPGQAHGLAFSVLRGVRRPPSLRNIFNEAVADVKIKMPNHDNLSNWSKQGVFLLNTCLTVRKAQANSHSKRGWEQFTDATISAISKGREGVVFVLWGGPAQV